MPSYSPEYWAAETLHEKDKEIIEISTLVWKAGMDEWKKAGDLSELLPLFYQTPPPIPESNSMPPIPEKN